MRIEMSGKSIIGDREYQQDAFHYDKEMGYAIVCDGMGGMENGDKASRYAVDYIRDYYQKNNITEFNIKYELHNMAELINGYVSHIRDESGNIYTAGTTLVSAHILDDKLFIMSIGDSRIYMIRNRKMFTLTREHNYKLKLDKYKKNGYLNTCNYENEIKRGKALISYLGMEKLELVDINDTPIKLKSDDIIILCSDGLYKSLSDVQILDIINENHRNMDVCVDRLVSMACECVNKKMDNTTVVGIRIC